MATLVGQQHQQHMSCQRRRGRRRINKFEEQPKSDRWAINPFWLVNSSTQMHGQLVDTFSIDRQGSLPVDWLSRSLSYPIQRGVQMDISNRGRRMARKQIKAKHWAGAVACVGLYVEWGWASSGSSSVRRRWVPFRKETATDPLYNHKVRVGARISKDKLLKYVVLWQFRKGSSTICILSLSLSPSIYVLMAVLWYILSPPSNPKNPYTRNVLYCTISGIDWSICPSIILFGPHTRYDRKWWREGASKRFLLLGGFVERKKRLYSLHNLQVTSECG